MGYASKFTRNKTRRGAMIMGKNKKDQKQMLEMAALLDRERGLPCKSKKGVCSRSNQAEINYRKRKRESLLQQTGKQLSPEEANEMLMCNYLRLTPSNVLLAMVDTIVLSTRI